MPVLNEVDVLPHVLAHLLAQGVQVHILDGWSTDGSYEMAQATPGVTVEHFPDSAPSPEWACRPTLHRIQDLAASSGAGWCLLNDADEWRRSANPQETLAEGVARLDAAGYNVIDHKVFAFFCTGDGWTGTVSPELYFHYYNTTDMICGLPQEKLWKNSRPVDLVNSGGHSIHFPGKRLAPETWIMKHYPFRTPAQARAKLETRLKRRCQEEHRDGWGVHYDEFKPGFPFCWNPADLEVSSQ